MKSEINFKEILKEKAKNIGLELNDKQLENFGLYKDLLIEWNEKINLTAITDEYQIIMKHFIDCLEIVKYIEEGTNIVDVGTGAGFPGLVIAIYFEGKVNITLLDALNKRLLFLEDVVNKLQLKNLNLVHGRAEELAHKEEYRNKYDLVVSRAVANLSVLLEYDIAYIKTNGKALLLKSSNLDNEITEAKNALNILNCKINNIYEYSYEVDDELFTRKVLEIQKVKDTPIKYPRNYGKIKKNPL